MCCCTPPLPLPAANSTHVLQSVVVEALSAAGVGMCKASLEELKYWQKHNFPHPVPAPSNPATIDFVDPVRDVTSQWAARVSADLVALMCPVPAPCSTAVSGDRYRVCQRT